MPLLARRIKTLGVLNISVEDIEDNIKAILIVIVLVIIATLNVLATPYVLNLVKTSISCAVVIIVVDVILSAFLVVVIKTIWESR
jgi:hypothetical protein